MYAPKPQLDWFGAYFFSSIPANEKNQIRSNPNGLNLRTSGHNHRDVARSVRGTGSNENHNHFGVRNV